jgi:hypothetical protein
MADASSIVGAYNLRKIERVTANGVEDQILQLVDGAEQVLAQGSHGNGRCSWDCGSKRADGSKIKRDAAAAAELRRRGRVATGPGDRHASKQASTQLLKVALRVGTNLDWKLKMQGSAGT